MVIGGQAVLIYGEPRLTRDIDVTLGVDCDRLDAVEKAAGGLKLKSLVTNHRQFVIDTMTWPLLDKTSGMRVDFVFSNTPYERAAIGRARSVQIGRTKVRFAAVEDIIVHKLVAARPRDLEDVRGILAKQPRYDKSYVKKWLKEFDRALEGGYLKAFEKLAKES